MSEAPLDRPALVVVVSPVSDRASVTIPTWKGKVQSGRDKKYIRKKSFKIVIKECLGVT